MKFSPDLFKVYQSCIILLCYLVSRRIGHGSHYCVLKYPLNCSRFETLKNIQNSVTTVLKRRLSGSDFQQYFHVNYLYEIRRWVLGDDSNYLKASNNIYMCARACACMRVHACVLERGM
jgi:hypothetical protein